MKTARQTLRKSATGIVGLDEILGGGLPTGRPTLVCGGPGCGKTLLAVQFLAHGARLGEGGVFAAFEENASELAVNAASLGLDVPGLVAARKLAIEDVRVDVADLRSSGEFDLEGLFIRLAQAIRKVKARRVVLDSLECVLEALPDQRTVRGELTRLFRRLKAEGLTAVVTGERAGAELTRLGIEEYVSDCVLALDHRVVDEVCTRRLRVVKYRGSTHGTNEYPFLIDRHGIEVTPVTSLALDHHALSERISTGIPRLDEMVGGGVFRGSSVLVSGTAGTGKTTISGHFVGAACRRGERAAVFAFEESPAQIVRNLSSVGLDLGRWVRRGLLRFHATRPSEWGLEAHLRLMVREIEEWQPRVVVVDPLNAFVATKNSADVKTMLLRLIDTLKRRGVTALLTSLTAGNAAVERTDTDVSSLIDTWVILRDAECDGERNRLLMILKARGTAHSNQVREFVMSARGVDLLDVYVGPGTVLTGSARKALEGREAAESDEAVAEITRIRRRLEAQQAALDARHALLLAEHEAARADLEGEIRQLEKRGLRKLEARTAAARSRGAEAKASGRRRRSKA